MINDKSAILLLLFFFWSFCIGQSENIYAENLHYSSNGDEIIFPFSKGFKEAEKWKSTCSELENLTGSRDALLVADWQGKILFSKNADKKLIPASTLKILTSLAAIYYLRPDYRFTTEFYLDKDLNLKIKGYGDPFLISEVLAEISSTLAKKIQSINDIILDDSYFKTPIIIPGNTSSSEPYDAPNGALCVNFNTVFFQSINGSCVSAEPQTPLLPFALKKIRESSLDKGRIVLSHKKNESTLYAGYLFQHFLNKEGIKSSGKVASGKVRKENDKLIYRYISKYSLEQLIKKLLEHSNNFIANQILIAAGANVYGPPGTLDKGVLAVLNYAKNVLEIDDICFVEGSGISRKNRISAKEMLKIIEKFEPYHILMRRMDRKFYKTGTLDGISTMAGYIENEKGKLYRFVILINSPGKSTKTIMNKLASFILGQK